MYLLYVLHGELPVDNLTIVNLKLASIMALCSWSGGHFLVSIKSQKHKGGELKWPGVVHQEVFRKKPPFYNSES